MKSKLLIIALILVFFLGVSILLYPFISDYWNSLVQSKAIASYVEQISELDDDAYARMLEEAYSYNEDLRRDVFELTEEEKTRYKSILDPGGLGIIGYIEIPSIGVSLPIYHGTEESVLQKSVGHLEWSSLPIGGEGTHSVISGHRGLPSAKLFTDLDKLVEGDIFIIRVLDEVFTYEVEKIIIVDPDDFQYLKVVDGEDLCTLLTCTPYGVNSHRLLIRGHRTDNIEELAPSAHVTADAMQIDPFIIAPILAVPVIVAIVVWLMAFSGKKKKKNKED